MLLQGDNNIFCAFQIFPATRTEVVQLCFSGCEETSKGGWPCWHDWKSACAAACNFVRAWLFEA